MPANVIHRDLPPGEMHPLHKHAFATLGGAEAYAYSASDVACGVRVGTSAPYRLFIYNGTALIEIKEAEAPASVPVWHPGILGTGLHADSDDFSGSVINPSWAQWDHAGVYTFAADATRKRVTFATAATATRAGGLYKAIPGAEFCVIAEGAAQADVNTNATAACDWGIMLGGDLSNSASAFVSVRMSSQTLAAYTSTSHSAAAVIGGGFNNVFPTRFLRLRVNGTTVHFDASATGFDWFRVNTTTVGFTPTHYGVLGGCRTSSAGSTIITSIRGFHVWAGAGTSDEAGSLIPGRLVTVGV